jgi:hypothetical protein
MLNLNKGAAVQVSHDGGIEFGLIESINYNSGKVLVAFGEGSNLNFCLFNISQVKAGA